MSSQNSCKITSVRLTRYINQIIPEEQFGFRKGKSTEQAIKQLVGAIKEGLNKSKGRMDALYIDFRAVFNNDSRPHLLHRLHD